MENQIPTNKQTPIDLDFQAEAKEASLIPARELGDRLRVDWRVAYWIQLQINRSLRDASEAARLARYQKKAERDCKDGKG